METGLLARSPAVSTSCEKISKEISTGKALTGAIDLEFRRRDDFVTELRESATNKGEQYQPR